jgi:hypothetical protein
VVNTIVKITLHSGRSPREIEDQVALEAAREVNREMDSNSEEFNQLE